MKMTVNTPKIDRIKQLISALNEASLAYYQEDWEVISNEKYDALYDELLALEKETGAVLSNSPTQNVGHAIKSSLVREAHEYPMLSLNKTKSISELSAFLGDKKGLLSLKLDGLTLVLIYEDGVLDKALTRGDGITGEVVTDNARAFKNIPLKIAYSKKLVVRGEAIITYSDFERINEEIESVDAKYKNPRNLASGSVRQLDSAITAKRSLSFFAFSATTQEDDENISDVLEFLDGLGFDTVHRQLVSGETLGKEIQEFTEFTKNSQLPTDGLVLEYDDIKYAASLGTTSKFPRGAMAFKWQDEQARTKLLDIEWSVSRTGLINPIAIFEPVDLEGTTVKRASLHNVSILEDLRLGIGDEISVYKANMIIPQVSENYTKSARVVIPSTCHVCGGEARLKNIDGIKTLHCMNPDCVAKHINSFSHFVSKPALDIEGLSEQTIEKLIDNGLISQFSDIYALHEKKEELLLLDGFQEKLTDNLLNAIEKSRKTTLARLLNSLGIAGVGKANAKVIAKAFQDSLPALREASVAQLTDIPGVGPILAEAIYSYFRDIGNANKLDRLLEELELSSQGILQSLNKSINLKTFVITGKLEGFKSRDDLVERLERLGGKVASSVSKNTDYLINNDKLSASSKNKKANELGIKIISENDILDMLGAAND